jgi:hypothetical protein
MLFKDTWRWPGMLIVLLVGFATFLHGVDDLILWADEAWTIYASDPEVSLAETYDRVVHDIHPPMFFLELHLWREFTGGSIFEMRYFSILLFMLTLAAIYRLGRALFSPASGILAGAFIALSDLERIFAQEVRHYSQQQLVVVLVMLCYWQFWQRPTRRRGIALAFAGTALLWSYYWSGFVLLGLACHALLTRPKAWRTFALVFGAMGLLYVPWIRPLYNQYADLENGLQYSLENNWESAITLARQLMGPPSEMWLLLVLAGIPRTLHTKVPGHWRPSTATLLPTMIIVVVVSATVILNFFFASLFARSMAIIIPAIALLVGHTLSQFRWPEGGLTIAALGVVYLTLTGAYPVIRATWDEVALYLAQHNTRDDVLLIELNYRERKELEELTLRFYLDRANPQVRAISTEKSRSKAPADFPAYLDAQLSGEGGLWVVKLGWSFYDLRADLFARGFVETAPTVHQWPNFGALPIEVWRLDRPPADEPLNIFGDTLQLMRASVQTGRDWVTVNLLWSPTNTPERNYTVSAFLLDESGRLVSQHDAYPMDGRSPTLTWEANGLYFDSHVLALDNLPPGPYQVGIQVYTFTDESFQTIEQMPVADCSTDCQHLILDTVHIGE